jgi:hypothetical protein
MNEVGRIDLVSRCGTRVAFTNRDRKKHPFMWKLQKLTEDKTVVLKLIGRIEAEGLSELRSLFESQDNSENLVLDLSEVNLAGRDAVVFLAHCEARGTRLVNCPAYIRDWIRRERNGTHS